MKNLLHDIKENNYRYKNKVYLLGFLLIVIKAFYAYSEIIEPIESQTILSIFNVVILLVFIYKILFLQKYSLSQIFISIIVGLACLFTDLRTNMFQLVPDFLLILASQDITIKTIIKIIYKVEAIIISIHVAIYPLMYIFHRDALEFSIRGVSDNDKMRHQLLLSHANIAGMMILWTILGYLYVEFDNLNRKNIIFAWLIYFFSYLFTDSNSGFLILTFVTIILLIKKSDDKHIDNIVTFLSRYLFIILTVFFDLLMIIFPYTSGISREIWLNLDRFFTGRLKYGAFAFYKGGFALIGRPLSMSDMEYWQGFWFSGFGCDNAYMWFSVCYGLFFLIIIGFLFWKYSQNATFEEKLIIISYSLYTMMELYITYIYFCFAILVIMKYVWNNKRYLD